MPIFDSLGTTHLLRQVIQTNYLTVNLEKCWLYIIRGLLAINQLKLTAKLLE